MSPPRGRTFELGGTADLVWQALSEPATLDELADDLAAVFDQPAEIVRDEVRQLLARLVTEGVVDER